MATTDPAPIPASADALVEPAIDLVRVWLKRATELETRSDRASTEQLRDLIADDGGVDFVSQFIDRAARPESERVAAAQLSSLVGSLSLPAFLSPVDRLLLRVGAKLAPLLPGVVMPLARRRMRSIVGHLVAPADLEPLARHIGAQRSAGFSANVNLLGEAVLGELEAQSRFARLVELLQVPEIDYVSVKISAVASQLNYWDHTTSLARVTERAADLLDAAAAVEPPTFVNFDMEDYHDLHLTVEAFMAALDDPTRRHLDAGLVLQAYLPDSFAILQDLTDWANDRAQEGGGTIKVRLVKGANLAMERVDAEIHGWEQAPYGSKLDTDANYRRCIDWLLEPARMRGVTLGLASHNLFDLAWTTLLAAERGVSDRVQLEMLQGMAPAHAAAVNEANASSDRRPMLLYTPAVAADDFDVAIGYLFRRLEENAAPENFMRALLDLTPDSPAFDDQADQFRTGVARRHDVSSGPRREQDRTQPYRGSEGAADFRNEPDTDPNLPANRPWIDSLFESVPTPCATPLTMSIDDLDAHLARARGGAAVWGAVAPEQRRVMMHRVADELASRRGELIVAMMHEANKPIAEADVEVSEAIDFARWYGDRAPDLEAVAGASFQPFGVIGVVPPWNFPVAIPAGGVLASLAAGNAVVFKPAPQTPRCAELVAEACWAAGVSTDVLRFVRTPDNEVGRHLVESVDAVILTGSTETADLFRSWKPQIRLFAETSGKNALIVTPSADLDLAAEDLIRSAFGHAGQKCSAASLGILVGDVYDSERFRRQLVDATKSLAVGPATVPSSDIGPLVGGGNDRLDRAASQLDEGEAWLVEPMVTGDEMTPGIRDGVRPGSWFHRTECFGPVLGLMRAESLDDAIAVANSSDFGLTGGIHTLDPAEIAQWADGIEVGNGYVNRPITGAIVQRQPFGGWKRSSVGPGAKAGGVNYLMQLGTWHPVDGGEPDFDDQWRQHFLREHDETALDSEANIFRYRPHDAVAILIGPDADDRSVDLAKQAARVVGARAMVARVDDTDPMAFLERAQRAGVETVRLIGAAPTDALASTAAVLGLHLAAEPVTPAGRVELQHYLREQALSITMHRFGNLVASPLAAERRSDRT